jgi:hypothetical protein
MDLEVDEICGIGVSSCSSIVHCNSLCLFFVSMLCPEGICAKVTGGSRSTVDINPASVNVSGEFRVFAHFESD